MKIAIGLPTNRKIKPKTALSILQMIAHSKYEYQFIVSTKGFNTAENRTYIAVQAIKGGCSHLLLLDDDMIYAPDSLDKLLACDKDIVGATYNVRREVAEGDPKVIEYLDDEKPEGLFKCKALGGGLLLIKIIALLRIKRPWFGYEWYDNGMVKMSNDWWFCREARNAGYDIWCDSSLFPGHIGKKEY